MRIILMWLLMLVIYCLVLGSFAPWNLAVGAVFAGLLILPSKKFVFGEQTQPLKIGWRVIGVVPFAGMVIWQILSGTWSVALVSLGLRKLSSPGIVAIPIADQTRSGTLLFCQALSLSPTSVLVAIHWDQKVALFHILDASNPDKTRQKFTNFYQKYQRPFFP